MIIKKDDTSLYATRDLATDKFRLATYGNEVLIINEVGAEQTLYFQQLFEIEKMLGWVGEGQRIHIRHGLFRFADQKMSTRKGNVIWLEEVLEQAVTKAVELGSKGPELAEVVGIGALKWNELKRDPVSDIIFDWKEILNMQGNSGPYVQYTYARTQSVIEKGGAANITPQIPQAYEFNQEERLMLSYLVRFPDIIAMSAKMYSPSILADYLFTLSQNYNSFYNKYRIVEQDKTSSSQFRLALSQAVGIVIKNGLNLLGIIAPQKM